MFTRKIKRWKTVFAFIVLSYIIFSYFLHDFNLQNQSSLQVESDLKISKRLEDKNIDMPSICKNHSFESIKISDNLIIFHDSRILYCKIPKSGSSNVLRMLGSLHGKVDEKTITMKSNNMLKNQVYKNPSEWVHYKEFRRLTNSEIFNKASPKKKKNGLLKYRKIIIVRNPYVRLLSSYNDKILNQNEHFNRYRETILNICPNTYSNSTKIPTFESFLCFVVQENVKPHNHVEEHWASYNRLCSPCSLKYDFIGHLETIDSDLQEFAQLINQTLIPLQQKKGPFTNSQDEQKLIAMYSKVNKSVLDNVKKTFELDFKLFGYDIDYIDKIIPSK